MGGGREGLDAKPGTELVISPWEMAAQSAPGGPGLKSVEIQLV